MATFSQLGRTSPDKSLLICLADICTDSFSVTKVWNAPWSDKIEDWLQQSAVVIDNTPASPQDLAISNYGTLPLGRPLRSEPVDASRQASMVVWHYADTYHVAIKGAPDTLLYASKSTDNERDQITQRYNELASDGLSVLAVTHAVFKKPPTSLDEVLASGQLEFDGLVGFARTIRGDARARMQRFVKQGYTPRLLSSDYRETARVLAEQAGLVTTPQDFFDCTQLATLGSDAVTSAVKQAIIFGRLQPDSAKPLVELLTQQQPLAITKQCHEFLLQLDPSMSTQLTHINQL